MAKTSTLTAKHSGPSLAVKRPPDVRLSRDAEAVLDCYWRLFSGRPDAYAIWAPGAGHWVASREPLSAQVVHDAAQARRPLSFYFVPTVADWPYQADHTHVGAVDVDSDPEVAQAIAIALCKAGAVAYLEASRRGAHVWLVADEVMPAATMRRALMEATRRAGADPTDPKIELRPASDHLTSASSLGAALRGPMQPHPATGRQHPLVDPLTGTPLGRTLPEVLLAHQMAAAGAIVGLAKQWSEPAAPVRPRLTRPLPPGRSPIQDFNRRVGVSAVLRSDWGVQRAEPGRSVRCPAHDDTSPSLSIARDDARAWCHNPECVLYGPNGAGHDAWDLVGLARAATP